MSLKNLSVLALVPFVALMIAGCPMPGDDPMTDPTEKDQFEAVRSALADYFASDPPGTISNEAVFELINDGDTANDPYILSVRSAEHYALGHVPGAENLPWRDVGDVGALADLPMDEQVVVYCYTGHTGALATTCINAMGYEAVNMKFGMSAWTEDTTVQVIPNFSEATDANNFPVETAANTGQTYDLPELDVTTSEDDAEIVRAAAEAYLSDAPGTIAAQDVFDLLNDGDDSNDPFILSVRSADHYAIGHVPGAINIPWKQIALVENLEMLPTDRQIVVYCYTGHTGGLATAALGMLGYDAVNMKFGIMAWTQDADVRAIPPYTPATDGKDYPVEN